jgi:hypothetical protein
MPEKHLNPPSRDDMLDYLFDMGADTLYDNLMSLSDEDLIQKYYEDGGLDADQI